MQIPNLLNSAVNNSLENQTTPLSHYVRIVFVLAVAAGLSSYAARLFLMRTAYGIEVGPAQHDLHAPDADELRLL